MKEVVGEEEGGAPRPRSALREVMGSRDFRLLFSGETVSLIGDQFYLIALPWLVISLSGEGLSLGTVLALAAVPRAILMLYGGAMVDRVSPRMVMILSNVARFALVSAMAAVVLSGAIEMWMVYLFALAFGIFDAFFYPAQMAIIPQLVSKANLQVGNSLVMGMAQVATFVGPVMAGVTIGYFVDQGSDLSGIGYALVIDALTFLVSVAALSLMALRRPYEPSEEGMLASIRRGLAFVWSDVQLRSVILIVVAVNFLLIGPLIVGIPMIADARLEGAVSFGIAMTAFGGGTLLGIVLAGSIPRPNRLFGVLLLVVTAVMGLGLLSLAFFATTLLVSLSTATMGVAMGYVNILGITWMQTRAEEGMMGRVMSLAMVAGAGVSPISMTLAGILIDWDLEMMYMGMGMALIAFTLSLTSLPYVRRMTFEGEESGLAA